jgi:hypothetical protein
MTARRDWNGIDLPEPIRRRLEEQIDPPDEPERPPPDPAPTSEAERAVAAYAWNKRLAKAGDRVGEPFLTVDHERPLPRETPDLRFAPRAKVHHAVRITSADGVRYAEVKSDASIIAAALDEDGRLEDFRRVMRRGRPTPDKIATRQVLAQRVGLLIGAGAQIGAIADVLGCGREAVSTLAGRAGTMPSRAPGKPDIDAGTGI